MTNRRRPILAIAGALLLWVGIAASALFVAAAIWLLIQGAAPSWIVLPCTLALGAGGWWMVRRSGVPLGEAMNL